MKFCITLRIVRDMPYKIKPAIKCHTQYPKYFVMHCIEVAKRSIVL